MRKNLKEQILMLAQKRFFKEGYHKVSLDSLVAELRTSKSSIYKYFRSKEAILECIIRRVHLQLSNDLEKILSNSAWNFEQKLLELTLNSKRILKDINPQFFFDLQIRVPKLWSLFQKLGQERTDKYYLPLFQEGIESKHIRAGMDLQMVIQVYKKLTELLFDPIRRPQIELENDQLYDHLLNIFNNGVLKK